MAREHKTRFVIVWKYRVRRGSERHFEQIYGPRGRWAQFFRKGRGYLGTHLYRVVSESRRYVTVDLWISRAAFSAFHRRSHSEYAQIDRQCEALTEEEVKLGAWTVRM